MKSLQSSSPTLQKTGRNPHTVKLPNPNTTWSTRVKTWALSKKLNANAYVLENERYSADDSGSGYAGNVAGPTTTKITTKGANINFDSRLAEKTLLKYGVNYRHQEIKPHTFLNSQYTSTDAALQSLVRGYSLTNPTKTDYGVYVEAIQDIGDVTLTGGLRYDHFDIKTHDGKSVSDGKVNPSLGVIYQPVENLSFSVSHNYASRSPRLYDALQPTANAASSRLPTALKLNARAIPKSASTTTTARLPQTAATSGRPSKDALANPQNRHDSVAIREAVNAGYVKNHGYELGASYRTGGLTAKVGVSHSKPRFYDTHKDKLLSANPEFGAQTGRTWTASLAYRFQNPNLEIGWRGRYVQKAVGSILVAGQKGRDGKLENVVRQGFGVNDVFANWKPLGKDTLNVNLSVNNVFNKFYYPHSQRWTNTLPGTGRDVRLGVNYRF